MNITEAEEQQCPHMQSSPRETAVAVSDLFELFYIASFRAR